MTIQSADKVKIKYRDGSGDKREVMAHNGHENHGDHIGAGPHTQTTYKRDKVPDSHQPIPH
jgi:hypothetical protein